MKELKDSPVETLIPMLPFRSVGVAVDLCLAAKKKVGQAFDYANRIGADFMAFVAPDEWERGSVCIKSLRAVFSRDLLLQIAQIDDQSDGVSEVAKGEDAKQVEISVDHLEAVAQALVRSSKEEEEV